MIDYETVLELSESEEGLGELLAELRPSFTALHEFIQWLKTPTMDVNQIARIMKRSNGYWDELRLVYSALETTKTNKELAFFHEKKEENDKTADAKKFSATATEKEARATTAELRRVRNWVEAYMEVAEKNIVTAQSLLKRFEKPEGYMSEGR